MKQDILEKVEIYNLPKEEDLTVEDYRIISAKEKTMFNVFYFAYKLGYMKAKGLL